MVRNCRNCAHMVMAPGGYRVCWELTGTMTEIGYGDFKCRKWKSILRKVRPVRREKRVVSC